MFTLLGATMPEAMKPLARAKAICPPPIKPILRSNRMTVVAEEDMEDSILVFWGVVIMGTGVTEGADNDMMYSRNKAK